MRGWRSRARLERAWPWFRILACEVLLRSSSACEKSEQSCRTWAESQARARSGLRTDHQPAVGLPALAQRSRGVRRQNDLVAVARRAVPPECRADPQGPRLLRGVR